MTTTAVKQPAKSDLIKSAYKCNPDWTPEQYVEHLSMHFNVLITVKAVKDVLHRIKVGRSTKSERGRHTRGTGVHAMVLDMQLRYRDGRKTLVPDGKRITTQSLDRLDSYWKAFLTILKHLET